MAFGDLLHDTTGASSGATTVTSSALSGTPAATDLTVALHHTGDAVSNIITSGFAEDQLITNATNGDEGAIYSKLGGATTVQCGSPNSDEQMLNYVWIEGPFVATVDVTGVGTVASASPCTSGTSSSSTAQGSEVFVAAMIIRDDDVIATPTWAALGTATPSGAPTQLQEVSSGTYKSLITAYKVLTGVGTVGATRNTDAVGNHLMGYATYKEDTGGGGGGSTHHIHLPLLGVG